MAGEKGSMIVIKKINVNAGAAHGGSWKVAFADFMTAMMCFFLVMWLIASNQEDRANVAEYFSTPSVIEYEFQHYGVELTLEKLFLDLLNEPLKVFQAFITPSDHTPNIMQFGLKKVIIQHIANELGDLAGNVEINSDSIEFEIPDRFLFERGSATPAAQYASVMAKIKNITAGLEDSNVELTSILFHQSVAGQSQVLSKNVAEARADFVAKDVESSFENETVSLSKKVQTSKSKIGPNGALPEGKIRFFIKQRASLSDGKVPRKIENAFGQDNTDASVYQNFVDNLAKSKPKN